MNKHVVIVLTLSATLLFGCGKSETTYQTPGGEVKVRKGSGEVTYEASAKDGQKVTITAGDKGIALPDNFPKDVPILKGAIVRLAATQGKQMVVHLHTPMPVTDAAKFYNDELKSQGWQIETTMAMGDTSVVAAKKDKAQCNVSATKDDDGTLVQLIVAPEGT